MLAHETCNEWLDEWRQRCLQPAGPRTPETDPRPRRSLESISGDLDEFANRMLLVAGTVLFSIAILSLSIGIGFWMSS